MAITNATRLSNFAAGIGTEGAILQIDNANQRIGIGTQLPSQMLEVAGIITAQSYRGDGSLLEGITSAGLGTAIGDSNTIEEVIYYTDDLLTVNQTTTVNPPASASAAYTQYRDVKLNDNVDLIIETGDDFIPDVLGLGTAASVNPNASGNGVFDEVYAGIIKNKDGLGAPAFANGLTSVGIITATGGFSGAVTGNVTGNVTGDLTGNVSGNVNKLDNLYLTADESNTVSNSSIRFKTDGTEKVRIVNSAGSGCVAISTGNIDPDGNKLLIRGASTIGTNKGHIMLTGDSSVVGEGPQIVFSESGPGANWAGAYIGHTRQGSGSLGDLRFGTRATGGNADTAPTERLRISSDGAFGIGGANYGTSGQVLTSQGSGAAVQWADAGGGQWKALTTGSATSGNYGEVTTSLLTSAYVAYKVTWYARMSSDGWVGLQQYHDGAYASDTNYYYSYIQSTSNGNGGWTGGDGGSRNVVRLGYTAMREWQGEVRIWRPDITTHAPIWYYWTQGAHANGVANAQINLDRGTGNYHWSGGVKTPTGCRLYADSTISYMWWTLYGLT